MQFLLRHDLHTLTGAYALDALESGAEQDRFSRHLRRCQSCAGEVRSLREVATALAFAAAAEPPPGLRARVLAAAARTRQLPREAIPHVSPRRMQTWLPRLAVVTSVVAIALAVIFGVAQSDTQHRLDQAQGQLAQARAQLGQIRQQLAADHEQNQGFAAVLAAKDVRVLAHSTTAGGRATVVLSAAKGELIVSTSGLPRLPEGKVYQLWLIGPPHTRSIGLLTAVTAPHTNPVLASGLARGDDLGLTVEPSPGTAQPTTTPILALPLPLPLPLPLK